MHILFLSDNFPPEVNAPASRTYEHCCEWVRAGHQVTVVTCAPNFPRGRLFDGYHNRLWQREDMSGISVIRVWTYMAANEGFLKRVADYLSFMVMAIAASPFIHGVNVVVATSPHLFTTCAGYLIGAMKRIPFVFELRDIWPESIRAVGAMKNSAVLDWLEKVELFLYRRANLIVSVTHSFREDISRRGIDRDKIKVVTNGVDTSRFNPRPKDFELVERYGLEGKFVAGYIGTHGMAHGLGTIIEAARVIRTRPNGDKFRFIFLGDGAQKAALVKSAQDLDNVIFVDSVPKDEVVRFWSLLDTSIIHLKKSPLFESVIPSKLFESMGMGIPVLLGVEGEAAGIVRREEVGLSFEPENAQALCQCLSDLSGDAVLYALLRNRGPLASCRYNRSALALEMLAEIENVASARRHSSSNRAMD